MQALSELVFNTRGHKTALCTYVGKVGWIRVNKTKLSVLKTKRKQAMETTKTAQEWFDANHERMGLAIFDKPANKKKKAGKINLNTRLESLLKTAIEKDCNIDVSLARETLEKIIKAVG